MFIEINYIDNFKNNIIFDKLFCPQKLLKLVLTVVTKYINYRFLFANIYKFFIRKEDMICVLSGNVCFKNQKLK